MRGEGSAALQMSCVQRQQLQLAHSFQFVHVTVSLFAHGITWQCCPLDVAAYVLHVASLSPCCCSSAP